MNQDEANAKLREKLGPKPRGSAGSGPPDMSGLGGQTRMNRAEMREWLEQADRVESEDAKRALHAGTVAGLVAGTVLGVVAAFTFGGVASLADAEAPRVVTRTVRVEVPREAPVGEPLYEERVPVCVEGDRAWGAGDYQGASHGGWQTWRCVPEEGLSARLEG